MRLKWLIRMYILLYLYEHIYFLCTFGKVDRGYFIFLVFLGLINICIDVGCIQGNVGLIFTKGDLKEVREEVAKYKVRFYGRM